MTNPTLTAVEERAEEIAALGPENERLGRLADAAAKLLRETGAVKMLQPAEHGGAEAHPRDFAEAVMRLASLDGSTGWSPLGGSVLYGPAAVAAGSTSWLFAIGTDHSLYARFKNGSGWGPWTALGGNLSSSPAAASLGTGHVRVFARGGDGALWSREFLSGHWSPWYRHGGYLTAPPTATADAGLGRIEVDVRGGDGYVYKQYLPVGVPTTAFALRPVALCSALSMATARGAADSGDGIYLDAGGSPQLLDGAASRALGGQLSANPAVRFAGADVMLAGRGGDGSLWVYDGRPGHPRWTGLGGYLL